MPWYPGISSRLTDEQLWTIVCADRSVSTAELAAHFRAVLGTVKHARSRPWRHGWACRVSYGVCRDCGRPCTRQGYDQGRREYHVACRPVAVQANRREPDRRRWKALPIEERRDSFARAREFNAVHQEATQATATQRQARWSEEEDAILVARADVPAPILAAELGRTLFGVYRRRDRLRARGLLP